MEDRRQQSRKNISYYLRIIDDESGDQLGHLIDFSRTGLRLLTEKPIETGLHFTLRLDLSSVMNFEQKVIISARSVWLEQDFSSKSYNCGFVIEKITDKSFEIVDQLVRQLGDE